MGQRPVTHVAFLIDESGSMGQYWKQTISSCNELIQTVKKNAQEQDIYVSFFAFSNTIKTICFEQRAEALAEITTESYRPAGGTALYDSLVHVVDRLRVLPDADESHVSFLVQVITDGEENSSVEHRNPDGLSSRIKALQATNRWTFTVLGANLDLAKLSSVTEIPAGNIANLQYTSAVSYTRSMASNSGSVDGFLSARRLRRGPGGQSMMSSNSVSFYGADSISSTTNPPVPPLDQSAQTQVDIKP